MKAKDFEMLKTRGSSAQFDRNQRLNQMKRLTEPVGESHLRSTGIKRFEQRAAVTVYSIKFQVRTCSVPEKKPEETYQQIGYPLCAVVEFS